MMAMGMNRTTKGVLFIKAEAKSTVTKIRINVSSFLPLDNLRTISVINPTAPVRINPRLSKTLLQPLSLLNLKTRPRSLLELICLSEKLLKNDLKRIWDDRVLNHAYRIFGGIPEIHLANIQNTVSEKIIKALHQMVQYQQANP